MPLSPLFGAADPGADPFFADVQAQPDPRRLTIQRVGVKALRHPLRVSLRDGGEAASIGCWSLDVQLPAERRGTHMSRLIALLGAQVGPIGPAALRGMLLAMLETLQAPGGRIEVTFPFFLVKTAPVSRLASVLDYTVTWRAAGRPGDVRIFQTVQVPVTSLCPCSKEISRYGAHNQRTLVTIAAELASELPVEALIRIAEEEASCELWGLLKRADEKFVTERAYENPKFVEDMVRDVARRLNGDARVAAYRVEVENFESIHNHSAYALIERDRGAADQLVPEVGVEPTRF
jgi:GTP cyclohydrolase IB